MNLTELTAGLRFVVLFNGKPVAAFSESPDSNEETTFGGFAYFIDAARDDLEDTVIEVCEFNEAGELVSRKQEEPA